MVKINLMVSLCALLSMCCQSIQAQGLPNVSNLGIKQIASHSVYCSEDEHTTHIFLNYKDNKLDSVSYDSLIDCSFTTSPLVFNYVEHEDLDPYYTSVSVLEQNASGCATSFKWNSEYNEVSFNITYDADNHLTCWKETEAGEYGADINIEFNWENGCMKGARSVYTDEDGTQEINVEFFYSGKQNQGLFMECLLVDSYYDKHAMTYAGLLGSPSAMLPDSTVRSYTDEGELIKETICFDYEYDDQDRISRVKTLYGDEKVLFYDEHYYYSDETGIEQISASAVPACRKSTEAIEVLQNDGNITRYDYFGRKIR